MFKPWTNPNDLLPKVEKWPTLCGDWVDRFEETFVYGDGKVFVARLNCKTSVGWETEDGEIVTHWTKFKKPHPPTTKRIAHNAI